MIVADLNPSALARRLRGAGLPLRTGPVVTNIRSRLAEVQRGVALHYACHPVDESGFADFHVRIDRPRGLRRWVEPQVVFHFDSERPFTPLPGDQGFPMLEWSLNWCVASHCHQYLIVHAAVLERGGRALVLPAPSGSGKSTLCAALVFSGGWRLLSDELALLDLTQGHLLPLPRPLSLKNASIDLLRHFAPTAEFGQEVHETAKGRVTYITPPAEGVLNATLPAMPAWVVTPRFEAGAPAQLDRVSRARAFMSLVDNAFNYDVHGRRGFAALAAMMDRCESFSFTYNSLDDAVAVFDGLAKGTAA